MSINYSFWYEEKSRERQSSENKMCVKSEDSWGAGGKQWEHRERKHSWPYVCSSVSGQSFCWPPPHAPSPHHSPACLDARQPLPANPSLLLPKQPHYDCVSSDRPTTSYLNTSTRSFMSAGHRFNTRPVSGVTGGLAGWRMVCLSAEAVLPSDWTPFWQCWGQKDEPECDVGKYSRTWKDILMS